MKTISKLTNKTRACVAASRRPCPGAALLLTGILAVAPSVSSAFSLYVDPTLGADQNGCGQQTKPCNSVSFTVLNVSQPGDDVFLIGNVEFPVAGVNIFHGLSIHGNGATVLDASGSDRHFNIDSGADTVSFENMVLKNGVTTDTGGSIQLTSGDLRLRNVKFDNNEAERGGAVYVESGNLLSESSEFTNNRAVPRNGGAINCHSVGSMDIFDSIFTGNSALHGGAIATNCTTTIRRSDFLENSSNGSGGGIYSDIQNDTVLDIRRSQFSDNTADYGGAIYALNGATDIRRSSFVGNYAAISGGGINANVVDFTVTNSTLSDNSAGIRAGGIYALFGSINFVTMVDNYSDDPLEAQDIHSAADIVINNSLINHDPATIDPTTPLCGGLNFSGIGNLIDNNTCGVNVGVVGVHNYAALVALNRNGGRTLSHGLLGISTALDTATGCNGPNGLNTVDQRGYPRPESIGADCDIGSFEVE